MQKATTRVQSILLPKTLCPDPLDAATWLTRHRFRAVKIEDSGKKYPGQFWRARQFDPTPGRKERMVRFGSEGIMAVVEIMPRK